MLDYNQKMLSVVTRLRTYKFSNALVEESEVIHILEQTEDGRLIRVNCPGCLRVDDTPLALRSNSDSNGLAGWRPIHIPSGQVIGDKGWSQRENALAAIRQWYYRLSENTQQLLAVRDAKMLSLEVWDEILPMFDTADLRHVERPVPHGDWECPKRST